MKVFLFDIGNVLADFNDDDLLAAVVDSTRLAKDEATAREPELDDLVERGLISDAEYVARLNEAKGLDWSIDELTQLWSTVFTLNATGRTLYSDAVEAGVAVCLLSNIAEFHINAIRNNWPGFFDGAEEQFLSYRIGVRKPHPDIYRHVLDALGVAGEECFFIDDLPENVEAARSLGIQAHRFAPETQDAIRAAATAFFGLE